MPADTPTSAVGELLKSRELLQSSVLSQKDVVVESDAYIESGPVERRDLSLLESSASILVTMSVILSPVSVIALYALPFLLFMVGVAWLFGLLLQFLREFLAGS